MSVNDINSNPIGKDTPKEPEGMSRFTLSMWIFVGLGSASTIAASVIYYLHYAQEATQSIIVKGRPFWNKKQTVKANAINSEAWSGSKSVADDELDACTREHLKEAWLDDAALEHASIAAFSDLQLKLLSVGAPPELLQKTASAVQDEIVHAQLCYQQASRYSVQPCSPAPLPVHGSSQIFRWSARSVKLTSMALESLFDGCVNEGVAAELALIAAERCDEKLSKMLTCIAKDETDHARLAWDILAWCHKQGGEIVDKALLKGAERLRKLEAPKLRVAESIDQNQWKRNGQCVNQDQEQAFNKVKAQLLAKLETLLGASKINALAA
jgi:hypothetical protein